MINYSLSLTEEDLRVVAAALNEVPYRLAAPVIQKLQAQVAAQDQKEADDAADAEAAAEAEDAARLDREALGRYSPADDD